MYELDCSRTVPFLGIFVFGLLSLQSGKDCYSSKCKLYPYLKDGGSLIGREESLLLE
jgi:hypothetical protein